MKIKGFSLVVIVVAILSCQSKKKPDNIDSSTIQEVSPQGKVENNIYAIDENGNIDSLAVTIES